jgi:hypothetical protein
MNKTPRRSGETLRTKQTVTSGATCIARETIRKSLIEGDRYTPSAASLMVDVRFTPESGHSMPSKIRGNKDISDLLGKPPFLASHHIAQLICTRTDLQAARKAQFLGKLAMSVIHRHGVAQI